MVVINKPICDKCKGEMKYEGVRYSGDVEYAIYKCKSCKNEVLKCMGVDTCK